MSRAIFDLATDDARKRDYLERVLRPSTTARDYLDRHEIWRLRWRSEANYVLLARAMKQRGKP